MKQFTIFGERNSGTKYLKSVLEKNIKLAYTKKYGFKHWYIKGLPHRGRANTTTDNECLEGIGNSDDTLFIFIVRNPYDWAGAMHKKAYHIQETDRSSVFSFIKHKYIAYEKGRPGDHGPNSVSPWTRDPVTKKFFIEESKNLITLRNQKNRHFNNLKNLVKNFVIIRQEHLVEDIKSMINKYNLELKGDEFKLEGYRKPTKYNVSPRVRKFISSVLNNPIDNKYYPTKK